MSKLAPEHLHLLLDEPIYVLHNEHLPEHLEVPGQPSDLATEIEQSPNFRGDNKKGILIIIETNDEDSMAAEDEEFLFKGLNALNIFTEDVAILETVGGQEIPEIEHSKCIMCSTDPNEERLYQIKTRDNITKLECHSLSQIRNDQDLKVSFWLGLKAILGN